MLILLISFQISSFPLGISSIIWGTVITIKLPNSYLVVMPQLTVIKQTNESQGFILSDGFYKLEWMILVEAVWRTTLLFTFSRTEFSIGSVRKNFKLLSSVSAVFASPTWISADDIWERFSAGVIGLRWIIDKFSISWIFPFFISQKSHFSSDGNGNLM